MNKLVFDNIHERHIGRAIRMQAEQNRVCRGSPLHAETEAAEIQAARSRPRSGHLGRARGGIQEREVKCMSQESTATCVLRTMRADDRIMAGMESCLP